MFNSQNGPKNSENQSVEHWASYTNIMVPVSHIAAADADVIIARHREMTVARILFLKSRLRSFAEQRHGKNSARNWTQDKEGTSQLEIAGCLAKPPYFAITEAGR